MHPIRVACALALLLIAAPTLALKSDRDKPLDVAADSLETTAGQARTTLTGNVRIKQGTLEVESEKAVVFRGKNAEIDRAYGVLVRAETLEGDKVEIEASGLLARALQHEIDHLNGILFIDRMSSVAKTSLSSRLKRLQKETQRG